MTTLSHHDMKTTQQSARSSLIQLLDICYLHKLLSAEMHFFLNWFAITNSNDVSSWAWSKHQVAKFWPGWTHPEKGKNTGIFPQYDVFSVMATTENIPDIFLMYLVNRGGVLQALEYPIQKKMVRCLSFWHLCLLVMEVVVVESL
jgi:hypothetical protein